MAIISEQIIFKIKMSAQEIMDFCNQYLISKFLFSNQPQPKLFSFREEPTKTPHTPRKHKFEKASKNRKNPEGSTDADGAEIKKAKKKKFEGGRKKNKNSNQEWQEDPIVEQVNHHDDGYVPIQALLGQLTGKSNVQKNQSYHHPNIYEGSFSNYQQFTPERQEQKITNQPFIHREFQPNNFYGEDKRNLTNFGDLRHKSPMNYQFSPKKSYLNLNNHFQENRSRSPLNSSSSCLNLSSGKTENKKERSFYLPSSSGQKKIRVQEEEKSPNTISSSSLLAKFERQIMEQQKNTAFDSQIRAKSKNSETREGTSYRRGMQKDNCSDQVTNVHLSDKMRQSLIFLSESRVPPRPINIQIKNDI